MWCICYLITNTEFSQRNINLMRSIWRIGFDDENFGYEIWCHHWTRNTCVEEFDLKQTNFPKYKTLPAASPQTATANVMQNIFDGSQAPLIIFTTATNRSIAIPTNTKLFTKIASVVANGMSPHIISPKSWNIKGIIIIILKFRGISERRYLLCYI